MKKQGQKAGAIGALLFALIPAFFMAACSTDAAVDAAAVTAELKAEKAKYETAFSLTKSNDKGDVSGKAARRITGQTADPAITLDMVRVSSGPMALTEARKLVLEDLEDKTDASSTGSELPWRDAMNNIQAVILQFEKDGITSNLDVLAAFDITPSALTDTWLVYGYDYSIGQVKTKAVLDLAKLNAADWIEPEPSSQTESFKYKNPEALALFASQSFIDDVLSGKAAGEIQAVYGTHLIAEAEAAAAGGPGADNLESVDYSALIPLEDLAGAVRRMHSWTEQDVYRQTAVSSTTWVSAVDIVTYDNPRVNVDIKRDWYTATNVFTAKQWSSGEWQKYYPGIESTDLNLFAGGKYIYSLFQVTNDPHDAIADLVIIGGIGAKDAQPSDPRYKRIDVDLNKGAGGANLYLCYRKVEQGDTEAVSWIGAWRWFSKISGGSPPHKNVSIKWWGTNAERDSVKWVQWMDRKDGNPVDLNEAVRWSAYVYMTMEKKPFKW